MDKKKVIKQLEQAINAMLKYNATFEDRYRTRAFNLVQDAKSEIRKSDWVSVEDRQPAKNVVVRVCNKQNPDDLILAYRTNKETMKIVYPNNVAMYSISHWKPIEKLEE